MVLIPNYVAPFKPLTNITPFTYRDGETYLSILENIRTYVNDTLVSFINESVTGLGDTFEIEVNKLITDVNEALTAQTIANQSQIDNLVSNVNSIVETLAVNIADQNTSVDDKLAAVDAAIISLTNYINDEVASLTTYVNSQVAAIVGAEATLNDTVVDAIVDNPASATRVSLDALYSGTTANDTAISNLIENVSSETRVTLDTIYGDNGVDDVVIAGIVNDTESNTRTALNNAFANQDTETIVSSGRLSETALSDTISDAIIAETDAVVAAEISNDGSETRAALDSRYRAKRREVACVLRRVSSTVWEILNDSGHESLGVASVAIVGANRLVLNYDFTASKVHSFVITIDDAFAGSTSGVRVGASVGLTTANIYIYTTASGTTPVNPGDLSTAGANFFVYGLFSD